MIEGLVGLMAMLALSFVRIPIAFAMAIAGGLVLILSGLHMLNAYFFLIPDLAA